MSVVPSRPPAAAASPLDRVLREDEPPAQQAKVSAAFTIYLFNQIVRRTACPSWDEWEARLAAMGKAAGIRSMGLAAATDRTYKSTRPTTCDDVVKMVATCMWRRWFGEPLPKDCYGPSDAVHFINDVNPVLCPLRPRQSEGDLNLCSYVGGMIHGVLETSGFPCKVTAVYTHPNDAFTPSAQYIIEWTPIAMDRSRRKMAPS